MSEELKAVITAIDKASPVFAAVSSGAQRMGTSVDSASKKGAKGLADQSKSAADLNTRMAALGAAAATAAGVLSNWSRSSQEADAIQRQLEASIAATGHSFDEYADRIQAAGDRAVQLGQDDEAASQAISALTQVTGSANTALDQMGLVMDLAAAKHMSLESAAELVGKVLEGNIGILGRAGFAIDENATATEALAQVQAAVAGQAEASATTYGRLREEFSNLTDSIGGTVGEFAPLLAMLPGVSVGFSAVGSAVGAVAPNLTKMGAATAALDLALGPAGLVAAAGIAVVGILKTAEAADKAHFSFDEATASIEGTSQAIGALIQAGAPQGAVNSLREYASAWDEVKLAAGKADSDLQVLYENQAAQQNIVATLTNYTKNSTLDLTEAQIADGKRLLADAQANLAAIELQIQAKERLILTDKEAIKVSQAIADITDDYAQSNYPALLERLNQILDDGTTSSKEKAAAILDLQAHEDDYGLSIAQTTARLDEQTLAENSRTAGRKTAELSMTQAAIAERKYADALHQSAIMSSVLANQEARRIQHDYEGDAEKIDAYNLSLEEQRVETIAAADAQNRWRPQIEAASEAIALQKQHLQEAKDAAIAFVGSQERIIDVMIKAGGALSGKQSDLKNVDALLDTQASIEAVFSTIVGGTQAIGQTISQVDKWASELTEVVDGQSTINDLRDRGIISQNQYNRATEAQGRIAATNAAIQDDLLSIQVRQAPYIEEQTRAYQDQIDAIADLDVASQRVALGFADQGERAKIASSYATAYSASLGEIPKDVATEIIANDAQADPILLSVLEKYGLIEEDAHGNITVNFDDAPTLTSAVQDLTGAVEDLTGAISTIPNANPTITLSGADAALGSVGEVSSALTTLDGQTANTYINTIKSITDLGTTGTQGGAQTGNSGLHGGVAEHLPAYASGGVVRARLAEIGAELLTEPGGRQRLATTNGWYDLKPGTLVDNFASTKSKFGGMGGGGAAFGPFNVSVSVSMNNNGAVTRSELKALGDTVASEVMGALKVASREHFAGWR